MANKPEQNDLTQNIPVPKPRAGLDLKTELAGLEEGSPEYKHKMKLIREEARRKKNAVVVDSWIEVQPDPTHTGGGKVRLRKRMKSGNVHTLYLGRWKRGGREIVEAYKVKGIPVRQPVG